MSARSEPGELSDVSAFCESLDRQYLTALAPPDRLVDWRLAVTWEAAHSSGIFAALPGSVEEIAARAGLELSAVRSVLSLISRWQLVSIDDAQRWHPGPEELDEAESNALTQYGVWVRRWSAMTAPRLDDRHAPMPDALSRPTTAKGLKLLAAASQQSIGPVVEKCLSYCSAPGRVLDLGGGHGEYALEFARRGCTVTLQDLPAVIDLAEADARFTTIRLVGKDMFEGIAEGPFDLVLCCTVTNMFDASANRQMLEAVRPQLSQSGVLAVVSYMRDRSTTGAAFGVQMLVATESGDAHSSGDYIEWLTATGYQSPMADDIPATQLSIVTGRAAALTA